MIDKPKKPAPKGDSKRGSSSNAPRNVSYKPNTNYTGPRRSARGGSGGKGGGGKGGKSGGGASNGGGGRGIRAWMQQHRFAMALLRIGFAFFILFMLALVYLATQLPDIRALDTIKKQQGITIEAEDGHVIANYGDVYGQYMPYDQIPKSLVLAVIATEDRRFFEHHGVDFFGIARAMVTNLARGHMVQGGSTVTQQVAKNVFLTPDRTLKRKLQEVMLAFWLESRFTKKEIMAIYLNRVYLGGGAFGIDAASHRYFNKSAHDLNLYESATLAGLLKAPSRYSPATNSERARTRVHQVLLNMVDAGYLNEKDVMPAINNYAKTSADRTAQGGDARYFTDWVVDTIPDVVGEVDDDLIVTTTMDPKLQAAAQDALQNNIGAVAQKKNVSQGALVAMKPDGAVQALVGGLDYAQSQYNRAVQAKRQPGSSFKLFVYLAALEAGMTPQSTVEDAPISIQVGNKVWSPQNFESEGYAGTITLTEALRYSRNTPAVRLSQYAGIGHVAAMADRLGVPGVQEVPSIALGSVEATLLEMTGAYAHLANGGMKLVPYGILSIHTRDGRELYKHETPPNEPVLAKGTVDMMNYLLNDVATRGTGSKASIAGHMCAGKTGTTSDYKDAWYIGFTSQLVTGVWVGNDDNKPMKHVQGANLPAPIWHDFMTVAMQGQKNIPFPISAGSSEGLLPWLFGGGASSDTAPPPGAETSIPPANNVPANSPFAHANDGNNPAQQPPQPVQMNAMTPPAPLAAPSPQNMPVQQAPVVQQVPAPANTDAKGDEVLSPQFWDKLMKKNPENGKVEYTYPGAHH